jgi:hypothetical protein
MKNFYKKSKNEVKNQIEELNAHSLTVFLTVPAGKKFCLSKR